MSKQLRIPCFLFAAALAMLSVATASAQERTVATIKHDILELAQSYAGQGDPDFSKQNSLDVLVEQLLAVAPQPPIKDRLPLLCATWKQVWGPYDYRHEDRRDIDPEIGIDEIYQAVFPGGYYYNVSPLYHEGDRTNVRIALLRGEYELDDELPNRLNVHFTRFRGYDGRPDDTLPIWQLASVAEAGDFEHEVTIVPALIVRLFFRSGSLDEVYTDNDLRIAYGSNGTKSGVKSIYIMSKVE